MTREELLKAIITELQKGKIKDFNEHCVNKSRPPYY